MNTHEAKNSGTEEPKGLHTKAFQKNICCGVGSKKIQIAVLLVGVFFIALVSFSVGVAVGFKKARFSYKFGENYERNFIGGPPGSMGMMGDRGPRDMMRGFEGRGFRNGHGIAGTVISIADSKIIIKDRDGQENTISVGDRTLIKRGQDTIGINDLKNDEQIVVMGKPDDSGTIDADLIRVLDNNDNN
jgi:hypothetical protein